MNPSFQASMRRFSRACRFSLSCSVIFLLGSCASAGSREGEQEKVFYPEPPDPPRIQFLMAIADGEDLEGGPSGLDSLLFGGKKKGGKPLLRPFGVTFHEGKAYITDTRLGVVIIADLEKKKVDLAPVKGRGRTMKPMAVEVLEDGRILVADAGRRQIVFYDRNWKYQAEWGPFGKGSVPVDVKVKGNRVYVVDGNRKGGSLRVLDLKTGKELFVLGKKETRAEFLRGPTSVAVDDKGFIYVVDTIYCQVYVWDKDGNFVRHIGEPGDMAGQFGRPKGIGVSENLLFVLDTAFENCQLFDLDGRILMFFGGPGTGPGQMYMPAKIWVGDEGLEYFKDRIDPDFKAEHLILVTNQFGPNKLAFYALGHHKKFKYPKSELPEVPSKQAPEEDPAKKGPGAPRKGAGSGEMLD